MLRRFADSEIASTSDLRVEFMASTPGVKRDNIDLDPLGCDYSDFMKSPSILREHDTSLIVARAVSVKTSLKGVKVVADFAPPGISQIADETRGLVKAGIINAVSVGFVILKEQPIDPNKPYGARRASSWVLLEVSFVAIPADTDAVVTARSFSVGAARAAYLGRSTSVLGRLCAARREEISPTIDHFFPKGFP